MDIKRLSRFGSVVKDRAIAAWPLMMIYLAGGRRWLAHSKQLIVGGVLLYLVLLCVWWGWSAYASRPELFTPFFTPIAALVAGLVALGQLRVARSRHEAQTNADFRRRINETYSKAVSQLASDKLEERLGGIYTLENISKESPDDYWTVMETLTAFVRERSQRNYAEFKKSDERIAPLAHALWEHWGKPEGKDDEIWTKAIQQGEHPTTDIAAVLTVIKRRSKRNREREEANHWRLNLSRAVLKNANLKGANLQNAILWGTDLRNANLWGARLEGAINRGAHLQGAHGLVEK
jgi:Pentapeptide repeats (8 copies)/Protein of unknown function (DUF2934)